MAGGGAVSPAFLWPSPLFCEVHDHKNPSARGKSFGPAASSANGRVLPNPPGPKSRPWRAGPRCCLSSIRNPRRPEKAYLNRFPPPFPPSGCRGTACRPLLPPSPHGTPGRATCPDEVGSTASRDGIHLFKLRLRWCDPEVATAYSSWKLAVGLSSKEKANATNAVTVGFPSKVG